jgi:hypothetical protein
MKSGKMFLVAALLSLVVVGSGSLHAQSQSVAPAAQPATATAPAQQGQSAPLPNAKPAKVWDNDQIDTLNKDRGVSVVGAKATQSTGTTTKSLPPEKDPAWYRRQLQPLQAEIEKLDSQIAKLEAFLKGEGGGNAPSPHPQMVPTPQDQLKQLEEKRAKDVDKVNDLLDRARHNDIPPGELR